MGDTRKPFFDDRPLSSLRRFSRVNAANPNGLIDIIDHIDNPSSTAVIIGNEESWGFLVPDTFMIKNGEKGRLIEIRDRNEKPRWGEDASARRLYRNAYLSLNQPEYLAGKVTPSVRPADVLKEAIDGPPDDEVYGLRRMDEEEIFLVGYKYSPIRGSDDKERLLPMSAILEGAWIVSYLELSRRRAREQLFPGDKELECCNLINETDAPRNGALVDFAIPSRSTIRPDYKGRVVMIPVCKTKNGETDDVKDDFAKSIAWSLGLEHENTSFSHDLYWSMKARMDDGHDIATIGSMPFSPHCVAAVLESQKMLSRKFGNTTAFDYSPVMIPSRALAEFYMLLRNNVLLFNPNARTEDHLCRPNNTELSVLLMRKIARLGYEASVWKSERDGKLTDYQWCIPGDSPDFK